RRLRLPSCFFSSRRRHTRFSRDWSSDVCSSDLKKSVSELLEQCEDQSSIVKTTHELQFKKNNFSKYRFIAIEGNIGAGKTTLARSEERRVGKEWRGRWTA